MGGTEGRTVGECGQCGLLEGSAGLVLPRRRRRRARVTENEVGKKGCP